MISIAQKKCTGCKICTEVCPASVLSMNGSKAEVSRPDSCLDCNQCVAVCPAGAVRNDSFSDGQYPPIGKKTLSHAEFDSFAASRRSIRCFKNNPVPRDVLTSLVESMTMAPTAKNVQEFKYMIIDDPKQLKEISSFMFQLALKIRSYLKFFNPLVVLLMGKRKAAKLSAYLDQIKNLEGISPEERKDPFLRKAPSLIILYCKKDKHLNYLDAGIAGYHLNLAALTRNLGTCWIGYHSVMCERSTKLKKLSGLDKEDKVLATIAVGYPKYRFLKSCARNTPDISFNRKGRH